MRYCVYITGDDVLPKGLYSCHDKMKNAKSHANSLQKLGHKTRITKKKGALRIGGKLYHNYYR